MKYDDPNSNESTEEQLRRQVEELKKQLRAQREVQAGPPADRWRPSGITISALVLLFVVLMVGAFFAGYIPLQKREAIVQAEANEREKSLPRMEVMQAGGAAGQNEIKLPGTMQAVTEAPILARADGYLKRLLADIGDRV